MNEDDQTNQLGNTDDQLAQRKELQPNVDEILDLEKANDCAEEMLNNLSADELIKPYIQKGHQEWSNLFDPAFS